MRIVTNHNIKLINVVAGLMLLHEMKNENA